MTDLKIFKEILDELMFSYEEDEVDEVGINKKYYNDVCEKVDPDGQFVLNIDKSHIASGQSSSSMGLKIVFSTDGEFMFFEPYED